MTRLGPGDMPQSTTRVEVVPDSPETHYVPIEAWDAVMLKDIQEKLARLREQFPPDQIEKLPKPTFKGAWDGKRGQKCSVCNGYHVLENCIHLDYVGHANVTNRLLQVDPMWEWEPMAYTEQGLPLFSDGGLWIRLTVCGVTRIGFGDGKSIKEVIGDAIRNAAMRFGVGLDLWAKIDLHAERNPGDGTTQRRERQAGDVQAARRPAAGAGQARPNGNDERQQAAPPRAPNQDALDALLEVCNDNGYSTQYAVERFQSDYDAELVKANADDIFAFAAILLAESVGGDEDPPDTGAADASGGEGGDPEVEHEDEGAGGAVARPGDPLDTSDVEPQPGDMF